MCLEVLLVQEAAYFNVCGFNQENPKYNTPCVSNETLNFWHLF